MSSVDSTCVVCFKNVDIFSVGVCDHPVCYECSTRMRALCRRNECPICRQEMPKVIFTRNVQPFKELARKSLMRSDEEFQIFFESKCAQSAFEKLLEHNCSICAGTKSYHSFLLLKDHMRKKHEMYYCDLCVDNLKIFSQERRVYNRQDLAHHRRKGDLDDKSHKGHPLCKFCDQRYMDSDELFRHLRKDHLFCHFCDADGLHQYYSNYDFLREHFKNEHYLCEEGTCYEEQFTSAFRSEIDLRAHRASNHSRSMGKQAAKQARTLEVEFTLAPRSMRSERNFRGNDRLTRRPVSPVSSACNHAGACNCFKEDTQTKPDKPTDSLFYEEPRLNPEDFPTLGGASTSNVMPTLSHPGGSRGRGGAVTIRAGRPRLSVTDENFPALSDSSPAAPSHKVWLSVNSRGAHDRPSTAPTNFSIQVNRRQPSTNLPERTMETLPGRSLRLRGPVSSNLSSELGDFPALKPLDSYRGTSAEQWVSSPSSDSCQSQVRTKVGMISPAEASQLLSSKQNTQQAPKMSQFVTEDFPCLLPSSKVQSSLKTFQNKKASVTIPMSSSWSQQTRDNSPEKSSDSEVVLAATNSKSKKKKKKTKNTNPVDSVTGLTVNKKVLSEQIVSNASSDSSKKKTKSKQQGAQEPNATKEVCLNGNDCTTQAKTKVSNQENQDPTPETSQVGRKRSELQIESLQINESEGTIEDTTRRLLTILRGDNYVSKSAASSNINPPPGFGLLGCPDTVKSNPPPGFSVKVNSVAQPTSSQLTFTSSSGESYPILPPSNQNNFVQPPDFQRRNAALMAEVIDTLRDPVRQEEFRQKSVLFRKGQLSSASYFKQCVELMGEKAFNKCFPEMLVLLPDIQRQNDLLNIYEQFNKVNSLLPRFETCAWCRQICSPSDLKIHVTSHSLENHFPALTTCTSSSAWNKK